MEQKDIERVTPLIRALYLGHTISYEVIFGDGSQIREGKLSAIFDNGELYVDLPDSISELIDEDNYPVLLLRPLSSITDEEAMQVAKIMGFEQSDYDLEIEDTWSYVRIGKQFIDGDLISINALSVYQYLHQLGFALPYYDSSTNTTLTPEQMQEYGIIKLK